MFGWSRLPDSLWIAPHMRTWYTALIPTRL